MVFQFIFFVAFLHLYVIEVNPLAAFLYSFDNLPVRNLFLRQALALFKANQLSASFFHISLPQFPALGNQFPV